jgi:hypothetical protein
VRLGDTRTDTGATFSPCGLYRYDLWRTWGDGPVGLWIMLNPSTADATANDPTVERCERRSRAWGWGGFHVVNLFALRSTDPAALYSHPDPIGPENNAHILRTARATPAGLVICAWGSHGKHLERASEVVLNLRVAGVSLRCLKQNQDGSPAHPLYLPYSLAPQPLRHVDRLEKKETAARRPEEVARA